MKKTEGLQASNRGRHKTNFKTITKSSEIGTKPGETRATFILNEEQLESIKALAHWERVSIKEVLSQAIEAHLNRKKTELPKAIIDFYRSRARASR